MSSTGKRQRRTAPRLTKRDTAAIFIKLRAAPYTLKETAELLKISLADAYALQREYWQEIQTEKDFITFKNTLSHGKEG